jgi:hypothetical protein
MLILIEIKRIENLWSFLLWLLKDEQRRDEHGQGSGWTMNLWCAPCALAPNTGCLANAQQCHARPRSTASEPLSTGVQKVREGCGRGANWKGGDASRVWHESEWRPMIPCGWRRGLRWAACWGVVCFGLSLSSQLAVGADVGTWGVQIR